MIKNQKIYPFFIFLIFLVSCGYTPIFTSQNVEFKIVKYEISGNEDLANDFVKRISRSQNNKSTFIKSLEKLGIETRPIISGNFTKQPSAKKYKLITKNHKFKNTDFINNYGLFIGLHTEKISNKILKLLKNSIFIALKNL